MVSASVWPLYWIMQSLCQLSELFKPELSFLIAFAYLKVCSLTSYIATSLVLLVWTRHLVYAEKWLVLWRSSCWNHAIADLAAWCSAWGHWILSNHPTWNKDVKWWGSVSGNILSKLTWCMLIPAVAKWDVFSGFLSLFDSIFDMNIYVASVFSCWINIIIKMKANFLFVSFNCRVY